MRWWRSIITWQPWSSRKRREDIDREISAHLELEAEDQRDAGLAADDAHDLAQRAFGNTIVIQEDTRAVWRRGSLERLAQDLRATLRGLRRSPGFTTAAILTMALAIGVNTAIFSVVHGVLLAPLPYPNPDRLTFIWKDFSANFKEGPLSPLEVASLGREAFHYEAIGGIWSVSGTLVEDGRPEPLRIGRVTSNFFAVLGVPPARGRWFAADDQKDGPPNIIISSGLWQGRFGGSEVLGRVLRIDGGWGMGGNQYRIVGIMPAGFEMLLPDASIPRTVDAWVSLQGGWLSSSGSFLRTVGRLAYGAKLAAAQEQVEHVGHAPGATGRLYAVPLHAELVREARPVLLVLQGAVGCVLLIACVSVAGLLLVRTQARRKEMGIRIALGATTSRLTRLLLTESVMLALAGGLLGVALASVGLRLLPFLDSGTLPRGNHASLNAPVLAFSASVSLASGFLFGLAPLFDVRRNSLDGVLKAGGRTIGAAMRPRSRRALVLAEISLSVMLLIGAGLLVRTFLNLYAFNPGFSADRVLTFRLPLPGERYNPKKAPTFANDLERALRALPGVEAAGAINQLPLDDDPNYGNSFWTRDTAAGTDPPPLADIRIVTPGYFETVQAHLTSGRWFTEQDDARQPLALIVDERLARRAWPGKNPVGQELLVGSRDGSWGRVVGVVRHLRHHRLSDEVREEVFMTYAQQWRNQMAVLVRSGLDLDGLLRSVNRQIREIDQNLAPGRVQPLEALMARSRAQTRFSMVLAALFAGLSLMLASVSLYGVISYSVAERTQEFGVRTALGASAPDLVKLVAGQ
jgi:predicted permease